jgi:hypothetical protein
MEGFYLVGIVVASITSMIIGSLWYSKILFGRMWMQCINKTPETLGNPTSAIIASILASVLTAIGISCIFTFINVTDMCTAVCVGLVLGLLIIFPAQLSDNKFCGWGNKLLMIQSSYRIINILSMCIVLYLI